MFNIAKQCLIILNNSKWLENVMWDIRIEWENEKMMRKWWEKD